MLHHVSIVQNVSIISLGIAAVFQVGDANQMELKSRAIAVHREIPFYIRGEGRFDAFEIFTDEHITIPKRTTDVKLNIVNECPFIEVNNVELRTLLNSGCFQIGNVDYGFNNSRIIQIRQYITDEPSAQ
ncbi:spore germination protein GerPE [Bacillus sp. 22475]|jgi:spore germination protein PE|uniref:Probable spore germination protein GerPE n=11 Tax=Bacillus cereus group TaxID=86661 RepID=GERPE_BACCE|nr:MULTISPECIES: spore germination protein GerPE [Bacillus]O68687.1 RecName: Full=Probable spore germination protein GerPE [Bacillus cereus]MDJ0281618.1 spore germination protein GerPE [Bacillus bombysepticus]NIE89983.1 spore germination protein GerPE [Bacillus sp. Ab-1751]OUB38051.1 spore gernimation protein GerPE [Bacillus thuringiensis serovar yunnanensis]QQP80709.1 spore germination protein GerPE [Bacillus sp. TK-2]CGG50395.1 Probable spore germination protein gerPE [Streptococcus pneumon